MPRRLLLIDGDILAYKFAAAAQMDIDWGDDVTSSSADLDTAKANLDENIQSTLRALDGDDYVVALSDPAGNFRKFIWPGYKANRKSIVPPLIRSALHEHLVGQHAAKVKPLLEGDDVLGILATNPKLHPGWEKVIVSEDKDMKTVPGMLARREKIKVGSEVQYRWSLRRIDHREARQYHLLQTLTGDATDGYPGCPGIGPKRAEKLLDASRHVTYRVHWVKEYGWPAVVGAYTARGLTEADALTQARLARILRHEDYDYSKKEPILWNPPA